MPHAGELLSLLCRTAPSALVAVGASPFTYTAPDAGSVVVRGGLVSILEVGRNGSFSTVGFNEGSIPVIRGDQIRITYSTWWPSVTFLAD